MACAAAEFTVPTTSDPATKARGGLVELPRARYITSPSAGNPYVRKGWKPSGLMFRVTAGYLLGLIGLLAVLVWHGNPVWLAVLPASFWIGMVLFYVLVPERFFHQSRIHSTIPPRWTIAGQLTLSAETVKTHVRGIYRKLEVTDRAGAVAAALREGIYR